MTDLLNELAVEQASENVFQMVEQDDHVPNHLRPIPPTANCFHMDGRMNQQEFLAMLHKHGISVINNFKGDFVITPYPEDFRPTAARTSR